MPEKTDEKVRSTNKAKYGRGNAYVAKYAGGNGDRRVVVKEVASKGKAKKQNRPPCLANHNVKPLS